MPTGRQPHGLGWFVQDYQGQRVVWQFGVVSSASSSIVIKVPDRQLTLVLLANSDGLVAPFGLEAGDVTTTRNLSQIFWHDAASPGTSSYIIRPCRLEPLGQRGEDRWRELLQPMLPALEAGFQHRCCIFANPARVCGAPEQCSAR